MLSLHQILKRYSSSSSSVPKMITAEEWNFRALFSSSSSSSSHFNRDKFSPQEWNFPRDRKPHLEAEQQYWFLDAHVSHLYFIAHLICKSQWINQFCLFSV